MSRHVPRSGDDPDGYSPNHDAYMCSCRQRAGGRARRMRRRRRRTGGGDVSEEAQPYVDALVESAADNEGGDIPFGEEQAECVAPEWVEILDPAELEAAGITPQELAERDEVMNEVDLTEDDGAAMYDALVECDVDVRSSIVASMGEDTELAEEDRQCLEDAFDDDMLPRHVRRRALAGRGRPEERRRDGVAAGRGLQRMPWALPRD